ncbi:MAG TPA: 5-formyltetrahydrofolate cyclo-ligase [Pseudonocardiaceae bacterium]|nr:5-formyltetrahydrofolate cyclo-ligase [Pseudonocardiaceae bacterium]
MGQPCEDRDSKHNWRTRLLAERDAVPAEIRTAEASALALTARNVIPADGRAVCGYVPIGTEPGALSLLDTLVEAGHRVLLPVVTGQTALDWAEYEGADALVAGPFGLREPAGDRLGPDALGTAGTLLVPALAVDLNGVRLGRGAGHYDRSLPLASENAVLIAVVRDEELVTELPAEQHDVRMTAALTPGRGLVTLRSTE